MVEQDCGVGGGGVKWRFGIGGGGTEVMLMDGLSGDCERG